MTTTFVATDPIGYERFMGRWSERLAPWRWATGIAARRRKKIAVVALARRLAGLLYAMLRDGTPYDPRAVPRHAAEATARV